MENGTTVKKTVNWGSVVKGALVVTAAVVVAAVAWYALGLAGTAASSYVTTGGFLDGVGSNLMNFWDFLEREAGVLWKAMQDMGGTFKTWITGVVTPSTGSGLFDKFLASSDTVKGIQVAGATVAAAASVPAATSFADRLNFVDHTVVANKAVMAASHTAEHAAHIAAEHASEARRDRELYRQQPNKNWTSRVPQPNAAAAAPKPRPESYVDAEALRKQTAELNKALGPTA